MPTDLLNNYLMNMIFRHVNYIRPLIIKLHIHKTGMLVKNTTCPDSRNTDEYKISDSYNSYASSPEE